MVEWMGIVTCKCIEYLPTSCVNILVGQKGGHNVGLTLGFP